MNFRFRSRYNNYWLSLFKKNKTHPFALLTAKIQNGYEARVFHKIYKKLKLIFYPLLTKQILLITNYYNSDFVLPLPSFSAREMHCQSSVWYDQRNSCRCYHIRTSNVQHTLSSFHNSILKNILQYPPIKPKVNQHI